METFEIRDLIADKLNADGINARLDILSQDGWADTDQVVVTDGQRVWYIAVTEALPDDAATMLYVAGQEGR